MQLSDVVAELYALPPAEFVGARDAQAARARGAGEPELAVAIKALRRPTVSAALLNAMIRDAAAEVGGLLDLGAGLRAAQEAGDGARLRELMRARQRQLTELERTAADLGAAHGLAASPSVLREVQATLLAATSDPDIEQAVRGGSLATALTYAGFGSGPVGPPPTTRPATPKETAGARAALKAQAAALARQQREARAAVAAGERAVVALANRLAAAEAAVTDLTRQLADARDRLAEREREATAADRA